MSFKKSSERDFEKEENHSKQEEELFLSSYNINDYERVSLAADTVVFSMFAKAAECHRRDDEPELSLLLIKRGEHPFKNKWALPGGFLRLDETIEECAVRELKEETNITSKTFLPCGTFSDLKRDPRGRIISNAFISVISEEKVKIMSGTDAIGVKWFSVDFKQSDDGKFILTLENEEEKLVAELKETKSRFPNEKFEIISNDGIAFDHAKIIAAALSKVKEKAEEFDIVFDFLPEKFTLAALQKVHENLLGVSLLSANFRRKISTLVEETEEYTEGAGHRPARLYVRKGDK